MHLNTKDRGENIYKCGVKDIYNNMLKEIKQMKLDDQSLSFSIGSDGTKVPLSLSMNNGHKRMMGVAYPNHLINTINLGKEWVNKTLENKEKPIALAQDNCVRT